MASPPSSRKPRINKAKVVTPRQLTGSLQRKTISACATELDSKRLVVVNAPAGFGKTTAMMQLVSMDREKDNLVAWLTLDESDNDVSRFLRAFSMAISHAIADTPENSSSVTSNAKLADWIIENIELAQQPISIYFDNFETIRNPVVIGLIERGIMSLPTGSRAIVGCRKQPEIGLAKLRAKGELLEFFSSDLRFSRDETEQYFLTSRRLTLQPRHLDLLYDRTEGWPAALWLASVALQNKSDTDKFISSFSGSNAAVASYLAEDVLATLEPNLKEFLLDISILSELDAFLCRAVSKLENSAELLKELYQQNLFIELRDEQQELYGMHALFRDFLQNQLSKQAISDHLVALHKRAATAYLAKERPVPAIRHLLKSKDYDSAISLLSDHLPQLLNDGRLRLIQGYLEMLPQSVFEQQEYLKLVNVWCAAFTKGPSEALNLLEDVNSQQLNEENQADLIVLRPMLLAMMDRIDEAHELAVESLPKVVAKHHFASTMLAQALTQTSIIIGDHDAARRYVDITMSAPRSDAGTFGAVLAESAEGILNLMKGELKTSIKRLRHAMDTFSASRKRDSRGISLAAVQLAEALYEAGNYDEALKLAETYSPLVEEIGPADALISTYTVHAKLLYTQDRDRAYELLVDLENRGHKLQLPRVVASARLQRANFLTNEENFQAADEQLLLGERHYQWPNLTDRWYVANDCLTPEICRMRWQLRSGKVSAALPLLRQALKDADRTQHMRRALKIRLLLAEAFHEDNQRNLSRRTMERALKLANEQGFVSSIREEGPKVASLILEIQQNKRTATHVSLDAHQNTHVIVDKKENINTAAGGLLADPLTPKEMQVLALLSEGLSNMAMSERLFVSESTVRTHLRSINLKLEAKNRTEAVVIARRLGILQ